MSDGKSGNKQEVFVTFKGERYGVNVDVDDSFLSIKHALVAQTGVPVEEQHLTANKLGIKIEDDKSLSHYRLNGGGFFNLEQKKK
jgi:Ubiquitin family